MMSKDTDEPSASAEQAIGLRRSTMTPRRGASLAGLPSRPAEMPAASRHASDKWFFVQPRAAQDDQFPIIVHSHLRWDFVWQRPQQIFSRLARDHRVLFVEEPLDASGDTRLELSEPHPNVVRAVPRLSGASGMSVEHQHAALLPLLQEALQSHPLLAGRFATFVQWFYSPMPAPCVLDRLSAAAVVYDCMDELANFRFAPPDIGERERLLLT